MKITYRPFWQAAICATCIALVQLGSAASAEERPSLDGFVQSVRGARNKDLTVEPHEFKGRGYLMGGVSRSASEFGSRPAISIAVDTICLLEADIKGMLPRKKGRIQDGCRKEIHVLVQEQLDLMAANKGTPDELREKVMEKYDKAVEAFHKAAKAEGFDSVAAGDKRWDVTFVTKPADGQVYLMNAGDYDVFLWCQKNGLAKDPEWIPANSFESFGDKCKYHYCARWGAKQSKVNVVQITKNMTIEIAQEK